MYVQEARLFVYKYNIKQSLMNTWVQLKWFKNIKIKKETTETVTTRQRPALKNEQIKTRNDRGDLNRAFEFQVLQPVGLSRRTRTPREVVRWGFSGSIWGVIYYYSFISDFLLNAFWKPKWSSGFLKAFIFVSLLNLPPSAVIIMFCLFFFYQQRATPDP